MSNTKKIYGITSILFLMDQITKMVVSHKMRLQQEITIIPNFFSLIYVKNTGAAFSILENNSLLLIIISVLAIVMIQKYIKKIPNLEPLEWISIGLLLGGIFGNLIDRIIYHAVIDFLSFIIIGYYFPIFNVADIGITVGICLLILSQLIKKKEEEK